MSLYINDIMQRCPACIRPLDPAQQAYNPEGAPVCPHCGASAQLEQQAPYLPLRTHLLQGRIGLGMAVEHNGDGITYIAFDEQGRKAVYVREFFPAAIALREPGYLTQAVMQGCEAVWQDCAQNFMELWRKLQRLRGLSALLSVTDVFEENGTIYAVYDHMESMTLREFLLRGKLGYISWDRARALLMPVLSTLGNLHQQGIIHRGISPNTLHFCADGKVRIGGFSIWQARTAHGDLTAELTDGYAALEQYGIEEQQGAWTDIYAFAAVLYRSLIGSDPDDAVSRRHNDRVMVPAQFAERIPAYVINALINAMQVFPEDRTRTVEQLRAELSASPTAVANSSVMPPALTRALNPRAEAPPPPVQEAGKKKQSSAGALALKTALLIIGIGLVISLAVAGIFFRDTLMDAYIGLMEKPVTTVYEPETSAGVKFQVPFLEGQTFSEELAAQCDKLEISVVSQQDDFAPKGLILRQSIQAGTEVEEGTKITLSVSAGKPGVELPDVVGKNIKDVRAELEALEFVVITNEMRNDGSQKAGNVKSMVPEPGNYPKGTEVYIGVWGNADGTPLEEETAVSPG